MTQDLSKLDDLLNPQASIIFYCKLSIAAISFLYLSSLTCLTCHLCHVTLLKTFDFHFFSHNLPLFYRIGGNITTDNTILKLLPNDFYSEVYRVITGGDNSVMQAVDLYDDNVQSDDLFSILFMAAFHGNTQDCECLLDNGESVLPITLIT